MGTTLQACIQTVVSSILKSFSADFPREVASEDDEDEEIRTEDDYLMWAYNRVAVLFVEECSRQRSKACARRNASIPPHRLPLELFGEILYLTMEEDSWIQDVTRLTSVSSFWRKVVESTPRFWTYINDTYDSDIVDIFIERSQSAPLRIHFETWGDNQECFFDDLLAGVLPHSHRFRSLEFRPWLPNASGLQLLSTPLSALEELTLDISFESNGTTSFSLSLPAICTLRLLSLGNAQMNWTPLECPMLQHLELHHIRNPPRVRTLFDFLAALPWLKTIILECSNTAGAVDEAPDAIDVIHLNHLGALTLGPGSVCGGIMRAMLTAVAGAEYRSIALDGVPMDVLQRGAGAFRRIWEDCESVAVEIQHTLLGDSQPRVAVTAQSRSDPKVQILDIKTQSVPTSPIILLEEALRWIPHSIPLKLKVGYFPQPLDFFFDFHLETEAPLALPESILKAARGLSHLEIGRNVNMDKALDYLAEPIQDAGGMWVWPCPSLEDVNFTGWRGHPDKLIQLAKARWQVHDDVQEGSVPRKKLKRLMVPSNIERDFAYVLRDCADCYGLYSA